MTTLDDMHNDFVSAVNQVAVGLKETGHFYLTNILDLDEEDVDGIAVTAVQELGKAVSRYKPAVISRHGVVRSGKWEVARFIEVPEVIAMRTDIPDVWYFQILKEEE